MSIALTKQPNMLYYNGAKRQTRLLIDLLLYQYGSL